MAIGWVLAGKEVWTEFGLVTAVVTHTHVCIQSSSQYKVYWGGKKKEDLLFEVQGIQIDVSKQSYSRAELRNARV